MLETGEGASIVGSYYDRVDLGDVDGVFERFCEGTFYRKPGYSPLVGRGELPSLSSSERVIERGKHELSVGAGKAVRGTFSGELRDHRTVEAECADVVVGEECGQISRRDTFFFVSTVCTP